MTTWLLIVALSVSEATPMKMAPARLSLLEELDGPIAERPDSLMEGIKAAASEQAKADAGLRISPDATVSAPGSSPSQDTRASKVFRWASILGGQGADAATTMKAMRNPNLREGNSFLYGSHPSDARIVATKGLIGGGLGAILDKTAKTNKRGANMGAALVGMSGLIPSILNLRMMKKHPK